MNTPVIDFHNHVGSWGMFHMDDNPAMFLRIMDAAGVDMACVNCIFFGDASRGNDLVANFVAQHPDRFVGAAFVTPHYPEEIVGELGRVFDELGMRFLKLYPDYFERPIDDPGYIPVFEWANDRGIVIMSHSSYVGEGDTLTAPRRFVGLAQRFSNINWVLAHSGNSLRGQIQAIDAAKACPNIYLETASSYGDYGTIESLVEGAGDDRGLYGSDMPLMDARYQISRILSADISDESKRKVLGLNAIRLLGLDF